jgi:hypothetical protein
MSTLHLPSQTLAWLNHAADAGQRDAQVLLHLIDRVDAQDKWFADFTDHYSKTIAALCRRLAALERGANLRQRDEDAEATESDSIADVAQHITDYASKAGLTVQDWAKAFNAAPVDAGPVVNALLVAESALADVAEGDAVSPHAVGCLHWAEARCTEALAAIRPVMKEHGIQTSEFPPAALAPTPATPTPPPTALVEVVGNELPLLPDGRVDEARTHAAIHGIAAWLDTRGQHACSAPGGDRPMMPNRIQITHQDPMTTPDIRTAAAAPAPGENLATPPSPAQAGSGLTRQSAIHDFRSRLTEEASSRYGLTCQDAEFDAFTSGASWAWATYVTAIAGGFGQAPQAGEVEA